MRIVLSHLIVSVFCFNCIVAQTKTADEKSEIIDSCGILTKQMNLQRIAGTEHSSPIFLANGVVVRGQELDTNLVESISIMKCPQSIRDYGILGINGVILIRTKQIFEVTSLQIEVEKSGRTKSKIVYALNGFIITDTLLKISKAAILEINIISKSKINLSDRYKGYSCINVWTLNRDERLVISPLCRGIITKH